LDLAVVRVGDTKEVSALQFVPLGDEPLSVIARSGHQLARMGERMV
jgi:DNA-binding transcriptional LysR family regulator